MPPTPEKQQPLQGAMMYRVGDSFASAADMDGWLNHPDGGYTEEELQQALQANGLTLRKSAWQEVRKGTPFDFTNHPDVAASLLQSRWERAQSEQASGMPNGQHPRRGRVVGGLLALSLISTPGAIGGVSAGKEGRDIVNGMFSTYLGIIAGGTDFITGRKPIPGAKRPTATSLPTTSSITVVTTPSSTTPALSPTTPVTASQSPSVLSTPSQAPPPPTMSAAPAPSCPAAANELVTRAPGEGKTVALTFDDGPNPEFTPQILAILAKYNVKATFFVTGKHAVDHPDVVRAAVAAGHTIAEHTVDHDYPAQVSGGWTVDYLTGQMQDASSIIQNLSKKPVCFFRPPGGYKTNVLEAAKLVNQSVVMWGPDSQDWKQPNNTTTTAVDAIVKAATTIEKTNPNHPIVLMHDGKASKEPDTVVSPNRSNTVKALARIIDYYANQGYTFVPLA